MNDIRNPTLHTAGLAAAEAAANAALRLSPHSIESLKGLAGQVLALECTRPALTVYVHADEDGALKLRGVHDGEVATRVRGSAEDFAELARAEDPSAALINGNLRLDGALAWSRQAGSNLQRQLREFATEEARLAPPPLELEHFYEDIQTLSERSERLAQRVERLRRRVSALRGE